MNFSKMLLALAMVGSASAFMAAPQPRVWGVAMQSDVSSLSVGCVSCVRRYGFPRHQAKGSCRDVSCGFWGREAKGTGTSRADVCLV